MRLTLDPRSPVPLYHQISEAIRYRVATGELKAGDPLPVLRDAARDWKVNLHTVRRAYAELARSGVVATRAPHGTRVLPTETNGRARTSRASERQRFADDVLREARLRHGLDPAGLVRLLQGAKAPRASGRVSVVECSRTQCEDLAGQIQDRYEIEATPWPLDRAGAPPDGVVVATYFHFNDVRRRWPDRLADVRFLPIAPEPGLAERIGSARGKKRTLVLCEREENMARNIAADLTRVLPAERFEVVTKVVRNPAKFLEDGARGEILLSPRVWGEIPARLRRRPRVRQVRYVFDPKDLETLATEQGWELRP